MITCFIGAAVACLAGSLYRRRQAWHAAGERAITTAITLITIAILSLVPPLSVWIGAATHALTGQWNLDAFFAHILCISADAAIVYHVASRIYPPDRLARGFKRHVEFPATVGVALMFAFLESGRGVREHAHSFFTVPTDLSLSFYWITFAGVLGYIIVYAIRAMLVLRHDKRSRGIATIYVGAGYAGVVALIFVAVVHCSASLNNQVGLYVTTFFGCAALIGFSVGAAYSWTRKVNWITARRTTPRADCPCGGKCPLAQLAPPDKQKIRYAPRADVSPF